MRSMTWVFFTVSLFLFSATAYSQELTPLQKRVFDRFDADGDGQLTVSEVPARMKRAFALIDSDSSKGISRAEYARVANRNRTDQNSVSKGEPKPDPYKFYASADDKVEIGRLEQFVLHDEKRKKDLQIRVTYPKEKGPFPCIVFCHGLYGSKDNYLMLTEFWAAHRYVVIQANHSDSTKLGTRPGDPRATHDWKSRPADVSFIFDSLDKLNAHKEIAGRIDPDKLGVGGHSFGAGTSQLLAGAQSYQFNRKVELADDRILAALLLSPQGPGGILKESSWENVSKPMLIFSGTKDGPTLAGAPAESRRKAYELSSPGDKYLVWVKDLDHGFGDITGAHRLPYNDSHINYVQSVTLAWWDGYLKLKSEGKEFLVSKKLQKETDGDVEMENK